MSPSAKRVSAAETTYGGVASARATASAEPSICWLRDEAKLVGQRSEQFLDLLGEMAGDDDDPLDARRGEFVHERHDDRLAVDRQDRLRPAVGQRREPRAESGGHDDRLYWRSSSTASRIAAAIVVLRRLRHDALGVARDEHDLVLADVEADVGPPDVVEDDEIGVLRLEHRALALEALVAVLGAERDQHLAGALLLAQSLRDVLGRLELDRPAFARPSGRFAASASAGR